MRNKMMAAAAAAMVIAAGTALAQSGGVMAVSQGPNTQTYDIPPDSKPQTVIITTRAFKPGESASPHIHHGVELAEVISGTVEVYRKGQKPEIVKAGGSFLIPREAPHDARNIGTDDVQLAVTLVIDKGTAPRTPVDAAQLK
ncbi:MAG: hypothetical protein BGN82_10310 [Alphaproteobacteria bacterium 65-7]|mgnify:CR=1 FL=1|nr:MAG: hypothetical protein BGN82_10310 [Alphaproteobacteria bacterium 65-7]